jgi:acyl-CoA thioester hydrolase
MEQDLSKFSHRHPVRVRFHHVDKQSVVHSLNYFYFFEEARMEYIRELGIKIDDQTFISHDKFFVVKNTCEYLAPAFFDEELRILTRISYVRNSSIGFEHIAVKPGNNSVVAKGEHVLVSVNEVTNLPQRVTDELRELIRSYEKDTVLFL